MVFFLTSIYFLTMMLVNFYIVVDDQVTNPVYLYFHQTLLVSNFALLIANLSAISFKCNESSTIFFRMIYKTIVVIMITIQLLVTANLWYNYPKYLLPFFTHFWKMPVQDVFSIIVARVVSCICLLSPLLLGFTYYLLRKSKQQPMEDTYIMEDGLMENPMSHSGSSRSQSHSGPASSTSISLVI